MVFFEQGRCKQGRCKTFLDELTSTKEGSHFFFISVEIICKKTLFNRTTNKGSEMKSINIAFEVMLLMTVIVGTARSTRRKNRHRTKAKASRRRKHGSGHAARGPRRRRELDEGPRPVDNTTAKKNITELSDMNKIIKVGNKLTSPDVTSNGAVDVNVAFCANDWRTCQENKGIKIQWGDLNNFCDTMDLWTQGGFDAGVTLDSLMVQAQQDWISGTNQCVWVNGERSCGHVGIELFRE